MKSEDKLIEYLRSVTNAEIDTIYLSDRKDEKVFDDGRNTYFSLSDGGVFGVLQGCGEDKRVIAVLCTNLAEAIKRGDGETLYEKLARYLVEGMNAVQEESLAMQLKLSGEHYVFVLRCESQKQAELIDFLAQIMCRQDVLCAVDDVTVLFAALISGATVANEYTSAGAFAKVLYNNIKQEMQIELKIGVGKSANDLTSLKYAYDSALFAIAVGSGFDKDVGVYGYKEYALLRLLSELPKSALKQFVADIADDGMKSVLSDNTLINTAELFFQNSLNVSETSRIMYMHRNTLIYRLDKIERETGLDLRRFADAMTFRVLTIIARLSEEE